MLPLTRGSRRWWNQESAATVVWGQEMADSGARRPDPVHAEPFPVRSGPFGGNMLPLTRVRVIQLTQAGGPGAAGAVNGPSAHVTPPGATDAPEGVKSMWPVVGRPRAAST